MTDPSGQDDPAALPWHVVAEVASWALLAVVLLLDVFTPLGINTPQLYLVPLWLTVWASSPRVTHIIAATACGLTLVGLLFSPTGAVSEGHYNRLSSIMTLIISAVIVSQVKHMKARSEGFAEERARAQQTLRDLNLTLERRVVERTGELVASRTAALNMMADAEAARRRAEQVEQALRRAHDELEQRVEARTAELAELTDKLKEQILVRTRVERQLRLLIEAAPNGILMADAEGKIVLANAQIERQFCYPKAELIGQPVEMLIPNRFRDGHPRSRSDFFARPSERVMGAGRDLYGLRKDGQEFPVEVGLSPIPMPDGTDVVLASIVDISERKLAEEALARHSEELERSNKELEQFAYVASHDLQEPLRMVASYVNLLQRRYQDKLDEDATQFMSYAVDGARRMKRLLEDLLDYSRVGSSSTPFGETDCNAVVSEVLNDLDVAIREAGATVTCDPLPTVMGDTGQLRQVFQNLFTNAIKFRGPRDPVVHVGAFKAEAEWLLWVRDNGIGIDPQFADRIFVIFQRLHSQMEYPGTGIGLALCKKIVERHGGRMWVESDPGQGSTFYLTIPTEKTEPALP